MRDVMEPDGRRIYVSRP